MPQVLQLDASNLAFGQGSSGSIKLDVPVDNRHQPLRLGNRILLTATIQGGPPAFGESEAVKSRIDGGASTELVGVWASTATDHQTKLDSFGLAQYFANGANADKVRLLLTLGASANANLTASYSYSALSAGLTRAACWRARPWGIRGSSSTCVSNVDSVTAFLRGRYE